MNKTGCMLISLLWGCLVAAGVANAEMYKWTDQEGNVHFGDKPPDGMGAGQLSIKSTPSSSMSPASLIKQNTKQIATKKPIKHIEGTPLHSVKLEKIILSLTDSSGGDAVIGKEYRTCEQQISQGSRTINGVAYRSDTPIMVPDEGVLKDKGYYKQFVKPFRDNNYKVITPAAELFVAGNEAQPDLLIGAIIKELTVNLCTDWHSHPASSTVTVASYIKVGWQVFDPLNRQVVYETTTEGSDFKVTSGQNGSDIKQTDARSFGNATNNLLSQPEFIKVLHKNHTDRISAPGEPVSLKIDYGKGIGDFVAKSGQLKSGTVTVRTAAGHGSGLMISTGGYLITNAHVVSGASNLLVIVDNRKYHASVVKENAQRDVALLKVDGATGLSPLIISKKPIRTGETIYIIGTPLDENLSHTVTRGILSSERKLNNKRFYQTDAAVNQGNSGGPAFNSNGEVIGITVAGMFAEGGGSLNINFIIPIDDALSSLGL